jgi:hypothetical protein
MQSDNKQAIQELVRQRRLLLNRIQATEAKLALLQARVRLSEVKLACFGHDLEKLRKAKRPKKMFKGRSIIRRISAIQRAAGRSMKPKELATILATQDGLDISKRFMLRSGQRRVRHAIERSRRRRRDS